jgi:2-succinyl-5-enolpyruvyl-6-hydroxy-3-cyclohexene-1-carboxylate synthase
MSEADVQATFAATLVDEWARCGVTDAVVAPGSRSTPLLLALAADGRLRLHVVLDERSAGFTALGLGLGAGRPAVVVTTSGTAAVELHPAVVEAHQAGVPLVAVTADRPPELHGVGAPQTVDQAGLFGPAVRWEANPGVAEAAAAGTWRSLAARAVAEAVAGPGGPGPVHLNLAFREPLLGVLGDLPSGRPDDRPWHTSSVGVPRPADDVVQRLAQLAGGGARGLILAGAGAGDPPAVRALAGATRWPVLADPRSGCRVPDRWTVAAADALLRAPRLLEWRPDVVVRLGRPWASRVVATWLSGLGADVLSVLVDPYGRWADPERAAGCVVRCDPSSLCRAVTAASAVAGADDGWAEWWAAAEAAAQVAFDQVLAGHREITEPAVARVLGDELPSGATLVVSSSMPVRDIEWYLRPRHGLRVLANRGANGIDGVISTALGVASASASAAAADGPTAALVGDLAFLYDAGALLGRAGVGGPSLTLVVVDNDGGGIFSFLPQASAVPDPTFERLWGTPHHADLAAVAAAYGVPVTSVGSTGGLAAAVAGAIKAGGVRVVLARTDRRANVVVHDELNAAVANAVANLSV